MMRVQQFLLVACVSIITYFSFTDTAISGLKNIDNNLKSTVFVSIKNVTPTIDETSGNMIPVPPAEQGSGLGSGIIMSKEGHIITNYHVIE